MITTSTKIETAALLLVVAFALVGGAIITPSAVVVPAAATVSQPPPPEELQDEVARLINVLQAELARLTNVQGGEELQDEVARLINVLQDELARLRPPTPPEPGAPEYCYDYDRGPEGGGAGAVCYTSEEACETDRASDPGAISTSCYQRQP